MQKDVGRKRIAMVAHDNMKADLVEWGQYNQSVLARHELIATGTTARILEARLGLPVMALQSGPLGGDQQLGGLIADQKVDLLIFFWDPLEPQPHDPDVKALLRVAVVWNLPVACNRATADFLVSSPLLDGQYSRRVPSFETHLNRAAAGSAAPGGRPAAAAGETAGGSPVASSSQAASGSEAASSSQPSGERDAAGGRGTADGPPAADDA